MLPMTAPRTPPTTPPTTAPFTLRLVAPPMTAPAAAPIAASRLVCLTTVGAGAGAEVTLPPLVVLTRVPLPELDDVRRRVVVPLLLERRVLDDAVRVPLDVLRRFDAAVPVAGA